MVDHHYRAFGSLFFLIHQGKLLWLLNAPVIGRWFQRVLRISGESSSVGHCRITRILPHAIFWWDGPRQVAEFRTHAKFSKRLYYAFRPLWWTLHAWDWCVADRWVPQLSFGFDTLTAYPDADPESTTVDGTVGRESVDEIWATIHDSAGNTFSDISTSSSIFKITASATSNQWLNIRRGILLFLTSSLGSGAVISAAVMSLWGVSKQDTASTPWAPTTDIYTSNPASNTGLASSDYQQVGTVSQTGAPTSYASLSVTNYQPFTFNATGIGNINKTGVSKYGLRNANYDVANSAPAWVSLADTRWVIYYADQTGTANDPKLVVTYTLPTSITPTVGGLSSSGVASRNDRGIFVPTEIDA